MTRTFEISDKNTPTHILGVHSRPFKRRLLQALKSADGKAVLNEVRFVKDFTPNDFEIRKKALPLMRKAFEEGKRVRFTKGKRFVDRREVSIVYKLIIRSTVVLTMIA